MSHVCSRWREVLWNSPAIWDNVDIGETGKKAPDTDFRELLNEILLHTNRLLFLSVGHYSSAGISDLIFLSFSRRFKGLFLHTITHASFCALLELPPGALNRLESLYVAFDWGRVPPLTGCSKNVREGLPNLKDLAISGFAPITSYMPHLPLSQLTDITINNVIISSMEIHSILQRCSSVLRADFSITAVDDPSDHETPKIIKVP